MTVTTDRDKVRLKVGDTDSTDPLLYDDEIDSLLADNTTVTLAAAAAAEAIAAKFARGYDFATDGQSFSRSQRVKHYTDLANLLDPSNARSGVNTIVTNATTRLDGYSDDIDYADVSLNRTGRVRQGYTDPDLPD